MQNYLGRIKNLFAGTATANDMPPAIALSYEQQIAREGQKWGEETKNERAERWINWLQHPLILKHYMHLALVNGQPWEQWVKEALGGPAERSLELGCGPAHGSQRLFHAGPQSAWSAASNSSHSMRFAIFIGLGFDQHFLIWKKMARLGTTSLYLSLPSTGRSDFLPIRFQ